MSTKITEQTKEVTLEKTEGAPKGLVAVTGSQKLKENFKSFMAEQKTNIAGWFKNAGEKLKAFGKDAQEVNTDFARTWDDKVVKTLAPSVDASKKILKATFLSKAVEYLGVISLSVIALVAKLADAVLRFSLAAIGLVAKAGFKKVDTGIKKIGSDIETAKAKRKLAKDLKVKGQVAETKVETTVEKSSFVPQGNLAPQTTLPTQNLPTPAFTL